MSDSPSRGHRAYFTEESRDKIKANHPVFYWLLVLFIGWLVFVLLSGLVSYMRQRSLNSKSNANTYSFAPNNNKAIAANPASSPAKSTNELNSTLELYTDLQKREKQGRSYSDPQVPVQLKALSSQEKLRQFQKPFGIRVC